MAHFHKFNDEAVQALKEAAEEAGTTYEAAKKKFIIKQDWEMTKLFWKHFFRNNPVIDREKIQGIDYCKGCKKFTVYYPNILH